MNVDLAMRKALRLLDNGSADQCESYLRKLLADAESENNRYAAGTFLYALGELFFEQGRKQETRECLENMLRLAPDDDVLARERHRAQELLAQVP